MNDITLISDNQTRTGKKKNTESEVDNEICN